MRAVLDVSALATATRRTGIGRYLFDLALALPQASSDADVLLLCQLHWASAARFEPARNAALDRWFDAQRAPSAYWGWTYKVRVAMARALREIGADVVHSGHPNATPLGSLPCPRIVTCHDLIPLVYPNRYLSLGDGYGPGRRRLDQRRYHQSAHVIAVSQATRAQLIELLGVPESRISVVHNGVELERWRSEPQTLDAGVLDRLQIRAPFVVYAGGADWRKNAEGMFGALKRCERHPLGRELQLVWAGSLNSETQRRLRRAAREQGVDGRLVLTGYVSDAELASLYRQATALLFVSRMEGFGYPIIEAMACGCPVITSDRSSMAEIAGTSAKLVDPENHEQIAAALTELLDSASERARLSALGLERCRTFSTGRMAEETLAVYESVARS